MTLADKIINLRKKQGWSQDDLAIRLDVSRQSVSKWENETSIPDLNKVVQMSRLFGVSTDYLLKEEIEDGRRYSQDSTNDGVVENNCRQVSMEDMTDYLSKAEIAAKRIASGVALCIFSPILLILLSGLSVENRLGVTENMSVAIGMSALLLMVAVAVGLFLSSGFILSKYSYLATDDLELGHGVAAAVSDKMERFANRYTVNMILGILLCILSGIPLIVLSCLEASDIAMIYSVCGMLFVIAIAVSLLVYINTIQGSFQKLLEEGDYARGNKKTEKRLEAFDDIYWLVQTVIYLAISFFTHQWHRTWILWPCAGVLFVVYRLIIKAIVCRKR